MVNMLDFAENSLYTTFPNLRSSKSAISADLSQSQKNHILKKKQIFLSKIGSRDVKTGPIGKRGQSRVRMNITYKPTNIIFGYENLKFSLIFSVTSSAKIVKENISENFIFPYPKMIFVGLQGMFMRTWDQPRFPIGPVLTSLEPIFDKKNDFFSKYDFFLLFDKSADMADFDDLRLGKVVYSLFGSKSNILVISITPISRKLSFRRHTP